jgi:UDP-glucose 4-epimerase
MWAAIMEKPSSVDPAHPPIRLKLSRRIYMKCLVTGAAGFLGSHLCQSLLDEGHEVVGLDDLSGGFTENLPEGLRFVEASVLDHSAISQLFEDEKFDYVYHLAAYAAEGLSHFIKRFNYMNNVVGSVNLINSAINTGVKCFVFTSSIAVYGEGRTPMIEDMTPMPTDSYGIAKFTVEQELLSSKAMFDLDYVMFRPHNVYGEKQNLGDPYRNVVGIFMNQIMQDKPLTIFGDGSQQRAFSYVGDIVGGIARSPEVPGARNQIFNIGADTPYTINELADLCRKTMGSNVDVIHLDAREEVKIAFSDHSKARDILGVHAETSLETGLQRVADWARGRGPMIGTPFSAIEVYKNMPASWQRLLGQHAH